MKPEKVTQGSSESSVEPLINHSIGLVLLAGGDSARMGVPKLLLRYSNTTSFATHILNMYDEVPIHEKILVLNHQVMDHYRIALQPVLERCNLVIQNNPQNGRMNSILIGLESMKSQAAFIHSSDQPFVDASLLRTMKNSLKKDGYVSPVFNNRNGHPVLLSQTLVQKLKTLPSPFSLRDVLATEIRTQVDAGKPEIHINVNTPEVYREHFFSPFCSFF